MRRGEGALKFSDSRLRSLPFIVECAIAAARAVVVFATAINAQVRWLIIRFQTVPMVNEFIGRKRAAQLFRHHHSVFKDGRAPTHRIEKRQINVGNRRTTKSDVALDGVQFAAWPEYYPFTFASILGTPEAFASKATPTHFGSYLSRLDIPSLLTFGTSNSDLGQSLTGGLDELQISPIHGGMWQPRKAVSPNFPNQAILVAVPGEGFKAMSDVRRINHAVFLAPWTGDVNKQPIAPPFSGAPVDAGMGW